MRIIATWVAALSIICLSVNQLYAQTGVSSWGNLRGIRVGGQLVNFTTAVGVFSPDFSQLTLSQREGPIRTTQYARNENVLTVGETLQYSPGGRNRPAVTSAPAATAPTTRGARFGGNGRGQATGFSYTITHTDSAPGVCDFHIQLTSAAAQTIAGVYYFINLPASDFDGGSARFGNDDQSAIIPLADLQQPYVSKPAHARIIGKDGRVMELTAPDASEITLRRSTGRGASGYQLYFPILTGNTTAGQTASASFSIKVSASVDTAPAIITLDPTKIGHAWQGMGGNYRIQNARQDPLHIQYILDNMRVAYGRVAIPWNAWQPDENTAPPLSTGSTTAPTQGRNGGGMNSVISAMEIAQKLSKQNIPMIISCWSAPAWALDPNRGGYNGQAQRLNPAKWDNICKSIGSYLVYLRDHYGAEPLLFSFNESNLGINVLQTAQDHDEAIKKLGAYFQSIGLKTKILLGDTSDALPIRFIEVALNDPDAKPFIGAVSFHSWRGATDDQYQRWADAADKLGVPLIDAEGGNDAQAASTPALFREPWYALDEAAEYIRIMRICQPAAILEWQLTENYSVLTTDRSGKLAPTQRFFNLKQFNLAPAGAKWIAVKSDQSLVLPAAMINPADGTIIVHLVNNGAAREVTLRGLPAGVTTFTACLTDATNGIKTLDNVKAANGQATFTLASQGLTTLISAPR